MEHTEGHRPWTHGTPEDLYERRNLGIPGRTKEITVEHVVIWINKIAGDRYIIIDTERHVWSFSRLRDVSGQSITTCLSQHVKLKLQFDDIGEVLYATFIESHIAVVHTPSQR